MYLLLQQFFFNSPILQLKMILEKLESNPIVRCVFLMFVNKC